MLEICRGESPAELVLKNGFVFCVLTEEFVKADLAVDSGKIVGIGSYQGKTEMDCSGKYLVPGFVDAHLHIESSMAHPLEQAKVLAEAGTTSIVADPHEIVNVAGMSGMDFMLAATEHLPISCWLMLPSSVPAADTDTNGAGQILAQDMKPYLNRPRVLGLGEVMRSEDAVSGEARMAEKLSLFAGRHIDGHAPGVSGAALAAYRFAGVENDHECVDIAEAQEKLRMGFRLLIREGTAAKNADALLRGVLEKNLPFESCSFCTDDKHLADIRREGHISTLVRKAISLGVPPAKALKMASWYTAQAFGLAKKGALIPGFDADILVLNSLEEVKISDVFVHGTRVTPEYLAGFTPAPVPEKLRHTVILDDFTPQELRVAAAEENSVIGMQPCQLVTLHLHEKVPSQNGEFVPNQTYNKLCVAERYGKNGKIAAAPLKGFGLRQAAIAGSMAHDAHNVIAAGDNDTDLLAAIARIKQIGGGYVLASGGKVLAELALPIGGLMSTLPADEIEAKMQELLSLCQAHGIQEGSDPFLNLSFLSLVVIPSLRLTEKGLVEVN